MKKLKILTLIVSVFAAFLFVGCEDKNAVSLSTPNELVMTNEGILSFKRVENDDYYVININGVDKENVFVSSSNRNMTLFSKDGENFISYNIVNNFDVGRTYLIKVKACGNNKKASEYSSAIEYTHCVKISTVNASISGTTLTWDAAPNATSYSVKAITPLDNIYNDTTANIESLDVSEYYRRENYFDFSQLLSKAGVYKFYIKANGLEGVYLDSDYSLRATYDYYINLTKPQGVNLNVVDDEMHLTAIVDTNASAIKVTINNKNAVLSLNDERITNISSLPNYIDVNLSLVPQFGEGGVDFSAFTQFTATLQALKAQQADQDGEYKDHYVDSQASDQVRFNNTKQLVTPTLTSQDGDSLISWEEITDENVTKIRAYVVVPSGSGTKIEKYEFNKDDVLSYTLPSDYISAYVQAVGHGNYVSSNISTIQNHYSTQSNQALVVSSNGSTINWTNIASATYVLMVNGNYYEPQGTSYNVFDYDGIVNSIKLYAFIKDCKPIIKDYVIEPYQKLLPTVSGVEFSADNPYLLYFNKVEDAVGYIVYLQEMETDESDTIIGEAGEQIAIQQLFVPETATNGKLKINLINFVTQNGTYKAYVQAVAKKYDSYENGQLSEGATLKHNRKLAKPIASTPFVEKVKNGVTTDYYINFLKVTGAGSYEIIVNHGKAKVIADDDSVSYRVPITMKNAGKYTIIVRALSKDKNLYDDSEYLVEDYDLKEQLPEVENINCQIEDDAYILHFDSITGAEGYNVRIVRLNDNRYATYLSNLELENPLYTTFASCDVTEYLTQQGMYYIYVTAIARDKNFYTDSNESSTFATVNKLESVATPHDLTYKNVSDKEYNISWVGDEHCDYYLVDVTDPLGHTTTKRVDDSTKCNINSLINVPGSYYVSVKAVVKAGSAEYRSSPYCDALTIEHTYTNLWDFKRAQVFYNGEDINLYISSASQLTKVLWYYYLFNVDQTYFLNLALSLDSEENAYIAENDNTNSSIELATRHAIIRLAKEASNHEDDDKNLIFDFVSNQEWQELTGITNFEEEIPFENKNQATSNRTLFGFVCENLTKLYPHMNLFSKLSLGVSVEYVDANLVKDQNNKYNQIFTLNYQNALNVEKIDVSNTVQAKDYGNLFHYLKAEERRSLNTVFKIDECETMEVSTTEELLMAVMHGKKPVFVCECNGVCDGHCEVAETVYNNAKAVLVAIANDDMSDLEKVTAIFDWLEFGFNINLAEDGNGDLSVYGTHNDYYLEGIFANTTYNKATGEVVIGNTNATSESFSKAFALLCGIEGVNTDIVNGTITYNSATKNHTWNKVQLKVDELSELSWYNVDLTYSDLMYSATNEQNSYNASTHTYFLVSDDALVHNMSFDGKQVEIKENTHSLVQTHASTSNYAYYQNATYEFTFDKILKIQNSFGALGHFTSWINMASSLSEDDRGLYILINDIKHYLPNEEDYPQHEEDYERALQDFYELYFGLEFSKKFDADNRFIPFFGQGRTARQEFIINALTYGVYEYLTNPNQTATVEIKIATGNDVDEDIRSAITTLTTRINTISISKQAIKDLSYEASTQVVVFRIEHV